MSILIKGVEMPEKQTLDAFVIFPSGYVAIYNKEGSLIGEAKAFPVPPHGRLIDADELYRKMFVGSDGQIYPNNDVDNWSHMMTFKDIKRHILFAPTIIPAEEDK